MITTTASPPAQTVDDLNGHYAFRGAEEVAGFLKTYPFLVPLLLEARPVIARHFGAETPVRLRVVYDRETGDEKDTQLVVSIVTDLQPEAADATEDRFRREWWLTNLRRAQDRLIIGPTYAARTTA